jgi:phospholipase/carboxylesterase
VTAPASLVHRSVAARAGQGPHPTLLLLHGRGSNELDLLGLAPYLDPRLFLLSARAPLAWMGGYRWYDSDRPGQAERQSFETSLTLLTRFLNEMTSVYPVDPSRLYLLGFSQGAMMSNALLLTVPKQLAGALLLSGFQPRLDPSQIRADALAGKPVFMAHGTHDGVLPVERGREARDTLSGLGIDLVYREYPMDHQINEQELVDIQAWLAARLDSAGAAAKSDA